MRVMLDDVDLASVKNWVPKYGQWIGGKRDHLVNFSTAGRVLTFILLGWVTFYYQQLMQIFLYKKWCEAWCAVFTVTKHWGGYCSFGVSFLKIIFQHKKLKLWNKWSFVQSKRDYLIIHHALIIQYITLLPKYIKCNCTKHINNSVHINKRSNFLHIWW